MVHKFWIYILPTLHAILHQKYSWMSDYLGRFMALHASAPSSVISTFRKLKIYEEVHSWYFSEQDDSSHSF